MSETPNGPGPRRVPRATGAPVSGALAMILAAIAVVAGFFILKSIFDSGEGSLAVTGSGVDVAADGGDVPNSTTLTGATVVPTLPPAPTTMPLVTEGATVVVANANGIGGTAGGMSRALETGPGFQMGEATDASSAIDVLETTTIYYDTTIPAAKAVAESVAREMGGATVSPLNGPPPVASGSLDGAGVLVMLGTDKANKTLAELNPDVADAVVTVTNPPVVGQAEVTTG